MTIIEEIKMIIEEAFKNLLQSAFIKVECVVGSCEHNQSKKGSFSCGLKQISIGLRKPSERNEIIIASENFNNTCFNYSKRSQ